MPQAVYVLLIPFGSHPHSIPKPVDVFDAGSMKRPFPATSGRVVRQKKLEGANAPTPHSSPPGVCNQNRPVARNGTDCPFIEATLASDDIEGLFHEGLSSADEEDAVPRVCFGVVLVPVMSAPHISEADHFAALDLEAFGDLVQIRLQDSSKYVGLIRSSAIRQLLDDITVQLYTTLTASPQSSAQASRKSARARSLEFTARIVVKGSIHERLRIGKALSDAELFFQHPYAEECGEFEYSNPHYLLRPGASMPKLQNSARFIAPQAASPGLLNEVNRNRIMRTFDAASLDNLQELRPQTFTSSRLKSSLKQHQVKAVAMMMEREGGSPEQCQFPSMWEITRLSEPSKKYRNKATGVYSEHAIPSMGGLLADDMGLGKTLSTLALICLSLDSNTSSENVAHTTLIVTTTSTLPGWKSQIDQHIHHDQLRTALYHGKNRYLVAQNFHEKDLVLTTYETLRIDYEAQGPLYKSQWHRIVLDEAHHIRNRISQTFVAACSIKSTFRWCLTGTPVHNSLDDYGALLSYLGTPSFNSKAMFDYWIMKPIREKKQEGFSRLQILVRTTCLRRTKETIGHVLKLPLRKEEIELVNLHPQDQELYDFFKNRAAELASGAREPSQEGNVLSLLNFLRLTCDHGLQILPATALKTWNDRDRRFGDHDENMVVDMAPDTDVFSAKVLALLKNLKSVHTSTLNANGGKIPVKSVVFSYWTKMLDLIQQALSANNFNTCRIDGSTTLEGRHMALKKFNEEPECSVMLATIGSAGEGLDLTVANNVHLIEPHWNPMVEAQAVDRVYRIGQRREVNVTRYIVPNSIETYIQWVQQHKLKLVSKIIDTEGITQAEIDTERRKHLLENLGCTA